MADAVYTRDDVLQAVTLALGFSAFGVGTAALEVWQSGQQGEPCRWGAADRYGAVLFLGGSVVHVSREALALVAQAQTELNSRCIPIRSGRTELYDLRGEGR